MNMPSNSTVGVSSRAASRRSLSRKRVSPWDRRVRGWGSATTTAPFFPPAIGFFTAEPCLSVNLLQLGGRPLDGVLRPGPLGALGEHIHDHVLAVDLRRLRRGRTGEAHRTRVVGRGPETLHRLVDRGPERMALPALRGADGEALGHFEPAPERLLTVEPLQEVLRELRVLRVLHHPVREGGVVTPRAGRSRRQPRVLDVAHQRLTALVLDLLLPALGGDVDRGAVEGGADLTAVDGAVVVGVVPS